MKHEVLLSMTEEKLKGLIQEAVMNGLSTHLKNDNDSHLIKINELSSILRVNKSTIHKWKKDGLIPYQRISNRVFFDLNAVMASLKKIGNESQ